MQPRDVVIVSACRTAIGKFQGQFKDVPARELAITAGKEAIRRAGVDINTIDEIVMGECYTAMQGSLPARQVSMRIGLPIESSAVTVNQNCASGMRALEIACNNIQLGKTEIGLVVGVENMTQAPFLLPKARMGYRMGGIPTEGGAELYDSLLHDALYDALVPGHMGVTADNVAKLCNVSREECDKLAVISHNRACAAIDAGKFKDEIVPVVIVMSADKAKELGIKPMAKMINMCSAGVEPKYMGIGPAYAIPKCLKGAGMDFSEVDYWEINEAFAAQFLGVGRKLKEEHGWEVDLDKTNANGSGISLGHPIGCTGLRIIVSMLYEMERRGATVGGASRCVGGGPAMASLWTKKMD